jgi:hypothetical protein
MNVIESLGSKMLQNDTLHNQTSIPLTGQDRSSPAGKRAARDILLLCTTASISPGRKEQISQLLLGIVDWRYLLDLAKFHGVTPMIAHNLAASGLDSQVPQPYADILNQIYNGMLYKNVILSNELTKVLSLFNQHGISAIVIKGTFLSEQLYGNPSLRTVSDMDILVQPEELSPAGSLLQEMGYHKYTGQDAWEHPFHDVFYRQAQFPLFIELHWDLDDRKLVAFPEQEIWHRAQQLQLQGETIKILALEDNLLFLSVHLAKQSIQMLKSLCDITELIKKYDGILDWDYIVRSAHSWGVGTAVHYSLSRSKEILGAPVPASAIRALKPGVWRRWLIGFLAGREFFISAIRLTRLRSETQTLVRSLTMQRISQTAYVLAKFRGRNKKAWWLRTAFWMMPVFGAALIRNAGQKISVWRR